jgi:hypothetical protein
MAYRVASVAELDRIPVEKGLEWRPIRQRLGIRAFGTNAYTAQNVGDWVVEEHTEESLGHEELYVVVSGLARFTVGDEEFDAPVGTVVHVSDPKLKRVAVAQEPGTTVLAIGGAPGKPFTPSPWEWFFSAYAQPPEEGIATMQSGLEELGEHHAMLYHLACIEARAGRTDDARVHLARAIELNPELAQRARGDDDLKGLE